MSVSTNPDADVTRGLLDEVDTFIAGGALNILRLPGGRRFVVERGEGATLVDVDGRHLVDFTLGSGPLILGHAHPAVVEAVSRQCRTGATFYTLNRPAIELARRLSEVVPCAEMVRYTTTGSEATLFALRLARSATGRDAVLKFEGGFHGNHDYALMSLAPKRNLDFPQAEPDSRGIPRVINDEVLIAPFNDLETARRIVTQHASRLAAIVVEPVQRAIPPQPGFLAGLRQLADAFGILLVFDEVVTGFRLALGGAQERYGVVPDLAALGKILGGGYPLGAVAGRRDLLKVEVDRTYLSGTLSGNPVSAAAALATIEALSSDGVYTYLDQLGDAMRRGLQTALTSAGLRAFVVGEGPMFRIGFGSEEPVDYRSGGLGDSVPLVALTIHLLSNGVFFTGKQGYLSTAHTFDDVVRFVDLVAEWAAGYASEAL